jgi:ribonuclease G
MPKQILISVDVDETRAAVLEDGELVDLAFERPVTERVAGNIYKGRVENVLPGMQAAFVDIGLERNAFLYVDDALPQDVEGAPPARKMTIKEIVKPGQEIVVQVAKEPTGTKGARVTRRLTLPGRFLVLMPEMDYVGISRRIADEKERDRLKNLANQVRPQGCGLIVRTVAEKASEEELAADAAFLARLWERIAGRARTAGAPALLHRDLGLVNRVVRDWFDSDTKELLVDNKAEFERIRDVLEFSAPALRERVRLWTDPKETLFDHFNLELEIDRALKRRVWLKSGGYIVIDQTEALTVVDVNTGKFVGSTNLQDTVFKTNLEAAAAIARQLRLRDIGGIIIVDFIDMDSHEHRRQVLHVLETELARDRTKAVVLGLTQLGLVEITRKKSRQSLDETMLRPCPTCEGRGRVISEETMARRVRGEIRRMMRQSSSEAMLMEVNPAVASLLIGVGGANLRQLEQELGKTIYVRGNDALGIEETHLKVLGSRAEVEAQALPVRPGEVLDLTVAEVHITNAADGIARLNGYVIDIAGAGDKVGQVVRVEVTRAYRTYAKARLVDSPAGA